MFTCTTRSTTSCDEGSFSWLTNGDLYGEPTGQRSPLRQRATWLFGWVNLLFTHADTEPTNSIKECLCVSEMFALCEMSEKLKVVVVSSHSQEQ